MGNGGAEGGIAGKSGDAGGEFRGIAGGVGEGVLAMAEEFCAAAGEGADDGEAGGHGFEGSEGEGFLPLGGKKEGVMGAVNIRHLLWSGVMESDWQTVLGHEVAEHGFVGGLAFAIDVKGAREEVADLEHGLECGEDAFVFCEAASEEELGEGLGGRGDLAVVALDIDGAVDDFAVGDRVTSTLGDLTQASAAEVEPREAEVVERVGGSDF